MVCSVRVVAGEQHPDIQSRDNEEIKEIATLPFHRVQRLMEACGLPQHVELQERTISERHKNSGWISYL